MDIISEYSNDQRAHCWIAVDKKSKAGDKRWGNEGRGSRRRIKSEVRGRVARVRVRHAESSHMRVEFEWAKLGVFSLPDIHEKKEHMALFLKCSGPDLRHRLNML